MNFEKPKENFTESRKEKEPEYRERTLAPLDEESYKKMINRLDERSTSTVRVSRTRDYLQGKSTQANLSQTETEDFTALASKYFRDNKKGLEALRKRGLKIQISKEGEVESVDWKTVFDNIQEMEEPELNQLIETASGNRKQSEIFRRDLRTVERNHRQRQVLRKVLSRADAQQELEEGTLTSERVDELAQEMAKTDSEMAQDLSRIQDIDTAIASEAQTEETAAKDLQELEPELSKQLDKTFMDNPSTKMEIAIALRQAGTSITNCTMENGNLRFDVPTEYTPRFADIEITPEGFKVKEGENTIVFPFNKLVEAVQGIKAREILSKEADVQTVLAANPERIEWLDLPTASKIFEIACETPFLVTGGSTQQTDRENYIALLKDIADMDEAEFEEFQEIIDAIEDTGVIDNNASIALTLKDHQSNDV